MRSVIFKHPWQADFLLRAHPDILGPPERKKAVFVSHTHDEAQMKMRSVVFADGAWVPNTKPKR